MKRLVLVNRFTTCYLSKLTEGVTVDEIMGDFVVTNEPLKVFLKYTISEGIAAVSYTHLTLPTILRV